MDGIFGTHNIGWTVLGVGQTHEVTNPERLAKLAEHPPTAQALIRTAQAIAIPCNA